MITIKITEVAKIEIASIVTGSADFSELIRSTSREDVELSMIRSGLEIVENLINGEGDGGMGLSVVWKKTTAGKDDGNMTMVIDRKAEM